MRWDGSTMLRDIAPGADHRTGRLRTANWRQSGVGMYECGLSRRDIEAPFADERCHSTLSRAATSEITDRLWAEYETFTSVIWPMVRPRHCQRLNLRAPGGAGSGHRVLLPSSTAFNGRNCMNLQKALDAALMAATAYSRMAGGVATLYTLYNGGHCLTIKSKQSALNFAQRMYHSPGQEHFSERLVYTAQIGPSPSRFPRLRHHESRGRSYRKLTSRDS
jgi:hypothetical protein